MEEDDGDVAEDEEGSVEILLEILQGFFKKVSRKAKKAARSVLPMMIPSKLVLLLFNSLISSKSDQHTGIICRGWNYII